MAENNTYVVFPRVRDNYEHENVVIEFNNAFTEPMKETEVQAILRCIPKAIDKFIAYEKQGMRSGEVKESKKSRDNRRNSVIKE